MQLKMVYDGKIIDGYMLNIKTTGTGDLQQSKAFTFSVLVRSSAWVRLNWVPIYSEHDGRYVHVPEFNSMRNAGRLSAEMLSGYIETVAVPKEDSSGKITQTDLANDKSRDPNL